MSDKRPMCRHCRRSPVNRPNGLCWSDYYRPEIRALYADDPVNPATAKYTRRGFGLGCSASPLPDEPTFSEPGSADRITVLRERARNQQSLFHPADERWVHESTAHREVFFRLLLPAYGAATREDEWR